MLKKRGIAALIIVAMLFSCWPVQAFAAGASITNVKVTDISETDATFRAVLNNPTGIQPSEVGIYFGESDNNMRPVAKDTYVYNQATLDFWYNANSDMGIYLEPATTYWYRLYAIINGETVWGPFKSMKTEGEEKPQASFGDEKVTDKTETNGTFRGVLYNPTGIQPSEVGCYIGTSSSNMKLLGRDTFVYNQSELDVYYNANDEGMMLEPGTKYYFQFYAIIGGEKVEGKKRSITTKEAPKVEEHVHKWASSTKFEHPHSSIRTCNGCGVSEVVKKSNYMENCKTCNPPKVEEHVHKWASSTKYEHPHSSIRTCNGCGVSEIVKQTNYMANCKTCNPPKAEACSHDWKTTKETAHPHKSFRTCNKCGVSELLKNANTVSNCTICNPIKIVSMKEGVYEISNAGGLYLNAYGPSCGWKVVSIAKDNSFEQRFEIESAGSNKYTMETQSYGGRNLYLSSNTLVSGSKAEFCFVDRGNGKYSICLANDTTMALTQTSTGVYGNDYVVTLQKYTGASSQLWTLKWLGDIPKFVPRTTSPSLEGYYGVNTDLNKYEFYYLPGKGTGNCTWYAHGRAFEITGKRPTFNYYAKHFWNYKNDYMGYSQNPYEAKPGAVIVWGGGPDGYGHVAVVEEVYGNKIRITESSTGGVWYNNWHYWGSRELDMGYLNFDGLVFYGYIYLV